MVEMYSAQPQLFSQQVKEIDPLIEGINDGHIQLREKNLHRKAWKAGASSNIQETDGLVFDQALQNGCDRVIKMLEIDFVFFCDGSEINFLIPFHEELEIAFVLLFLSIS